MASNKPRWKYKTKKDMIIIEEYLMMSVTWN